MLINGIAGAIHSAIPQVCWGSWDRINAAKTVHELPRSRELGLRLRPADDLGIASRRLPLSETSRVPSMVNHRGAAILCADSLYRDRTLSCSTLKIAD